MRALDLKLSRDLQRMWAQALAIALVIAGGVTTLVLSVGSYRSLDETRLTYYDRYRFADVFAHARRAPKSLVDRIAEIPGVAAVDARIAKLVLLDLPDFREPASAQFVSLPDAGPPILNLLYMRAGRMPEPERGEEVVVNESFANAHRLMLGSRFSATLNGRKQELVVVGIALSPEFVYAIGPGDIMPDDRRFGIVWISERALANAYDLEGAFSSVSIKLLRDASEREVIQRLDALLERYGGQAAYGRKDQTSHAFLDHGLDMLNNITRTLPPIFLLVSIFLVNLTLSRIVALEREQIGLLKAVGYGNAAIAFHYIKFVLAVALLGIVIGSFAGMWLGVHVTRLYGDYYRFPFLVFVQSPDIYVAAAVLSLATGVIGAIRALRDVVALAPAVAMRPPVPPSFHRMLPDWFAVTRIVSQPTMMMLRNVGRRPLRAILTLIGMSSATGILIVSLFMRDSMEQTIDVTYFMTDRHDASVSFVDKRPLNVVDQVARLPGVLAVEPYRELPARIRFGNIERRVVISGRPRDADLRRVVDIELRSVVIPDGGLAISSELAKVLGARQGDVVDVDLLEDERRTVSLPIAMLVEDYFGLKAMMNASSLARLLREAPAVNSVSLIVDSAEIDGLYQAVKNMPVVSGMAQQQASLTNFRDAVAVLVTTMAGIYTGLAAIIAFGLVYNSARISLSERSRELASLRVLGFTSSEVFRILVLELALLTLLAQPPGWAIGYGLAWIMQKNLAGELMRVPLTMENLTYAIATGVVLAATIASALIVRERINRLDLVAVLKTRD